MKMQMGYCLAGSLTVVDPDIVGCGFIQTVNLDLGMVQQLKKCLSLFGIGMEERRHVTFGNNQTMAEGYRISISNHEGIFVLIENPFMIPCRYNFAEWT